MNQAHARTLTHAIVAWTCLVNRAAVGGTVSEVTREAIAFDGARQREKPVVSLLPTVEARKDKEENSAGRCALTLRDDAAHGHNAPTWSNARGDVIGRPDWFGSVK